MPYKSKAQAAYFNIHKAELEKQGVDVGEWNQASKGMSLPSHAGAHAARKAEKAAGKTPGSYHRAAYEARRK